MAQNPKKLQKPEKTISKSNATAVYLVLRALVIMTMVAQFYNQNFENAFMCIFALVLFTLPSAFQRKMNVDLPNALEAIILIFIFASLILGEIRSFYITYPHWDMILHTINGFLCAAIGFSLVDMFNRESRFSLSLSPLFMAIVAFCFSMTVGVVWEFFELGMDLFFGTDMQKDTIVNQIISVNLDPTDSNIPVLIDGITDVIVVSHGEEIALGLGGYLDLGIYDTMEDLVVNFIGAVAFSVVGYFYVKSRGQGKFASSLIPKVNSNAKK